MSKDKINIFPSRMSLALMKTRLKGAQKGHSLLKKKADALSLRFRQILGKIIQTKTLMGEVMKEAQFSLAEANFAAGDFSQTVLQNVDKAQLKLKIKKDNVAGRWRVLLREECEVSRTSCICVMFHFNTLGRRP